MDDFSDDDFDALNANVLQELENNAIQFTQAQKKYQPSQTQQHQAPLDDNFDDDDLDDAVVQDELGDASVQPPSRVPQQQTTWDGPMPIPASRFRPQPVASSSRPPITAPTSSRPLQPPIARGPPPSYSQIRPPPPLARPAPSIYQASQAPRPTAPPSHELSSLQAQILDLKTRLNTKDGEIGIVRKRLEKARADHDRELQSIKKQAAEQVAKHERALEAAKAAQDAANTELQFTRRDLKDELERARRKDGPSTPKKNAAAKSWGIADGFEDVEIAGSPSKGQRGKNSGAVASVVAEPSLKPTRTPTKGKRKRQVVDSPVTALETHSEDVVMVDIGANDNNVIESSSSSPKAASIDYLKVILNHSSAHGRPLAFEFLAGFRLPSKPDESLASTLIQKLAVIGDPSDPMRLPIEFCEQVIHLWDSCLKEGCLAPIMELVSLVSLTVQLYTSAVAPYIAPSLLPVAMDSCYEVGIPRFYNEGPGDPMTDAWRNFNANISTTEILSLLFLTALGCAASPPVGGGVTDPAIDFWGQVHVEFILMQLSQKHPVEDYLTVLRWLCTSVFPESIGPISPNKTVEVIAATVIERVSLQLVETPRPDIDQYKLRSIRNSVLRTLAAFARSSFGLAQLAINDWAIPRLVTLLSSCIDDLYDGDMRYEASEGDDSQKDLQALVAHAVLLLHTIITNPLTADLVNVSAKLARSLAGLQKYVLSLGRLNFSEELVSEETAELAHELLELAVTPEEGEELGRFFGG
ncbi:hypothetical protein GGR53DRAFT_405445 [Hypoxylon sp. FL1150]|nr:hypothetical protein GGR53DRAFT_405445 [Hypoxylon sp. FL1150]